ncbi:MAG: IS66 family transposase [Beijerinckiaceae bacterium]|nr:IS66 family transposase [Beijerinckiaceae bacterium]
MQSHASTLLPDDIDALKAMIAASRAELYAQALLIEKLKAQLASQNRYRFGARSEGLDQLELIIDNARIADARRTAPEPDVERPTKGQPKRKALPDHLPRQTVVHTPVDRCCRDCGKPLRKMGEDMREVLDFVPGRFVVRRHVCEKFSCRDCGGIVEGQLPSMPIEKGLPGAGLLAHVLVSKFCDHLPLYRQSAIYAREGVHLSRATMAGWAQKMAKLLAPLADRIQSHVLGGEAIHTDDTPVSVLDPGRGRTKTGRYWTHVRDERPRASAVPPAAFYRYSPDRKAAHPRDHLKNYAGFLHADGYAGYEELYRKRSIAEVACMAHVRRKFFDIHKATAAPIAEDALLRIAALYRIEKAIRGKPPDERRRVRQEQAKPSFQELQDWLEATLPSLPARGSLAKAVRYAIARMKRLAVYLGDGRLEIDNNAAERSVRGVCLGKKNYLFAGADSGGESGAVIYTLVETAKLNGVDAEAWLAHVIANIAKHPMSRIDDFLPWNYRPCVN